MAGSLNIEILQTGSADDLRKLEAAWKEIQRSGGVSHPMYTWEWMGTWWEIFGEGRSLLAIIVREGGKAVAIAPFVRRKARMDRLFSFRRLELMGTGEPEQDEVYSEYVDLPTIPGTGSEVAETLIEELFEAVGQDECDDVVFYRVRLKSIVHHVARKLAEKKGLTMSHLSSGKCPYAALPGRLEQYDQKLSSSRRQQIRRSIRSLERKGKVSFAKAETVVNALETLNQLSELHEARWTTCGKPGAFASAKFSEFHNRFIRRTFSMGWPELWTLRVGTEAVACLYNIRYRDRICFYQSGVKTFKDNRLRPGIVAHYFAIKDAIESGAKEYDFLLGESRYKMSLSNATRELVTLRVSRDSPKERFRRVVVPAAKQAWKPFLWLGHKWRS